MLVNPQNTGFLQTKLKNLRAKKRKLDSDVRIDEYNDEDEIEKLVDNMDEQNELFNKLMNLILPEQLNMAQKYLEKTKEFRRKLVKEKSGAIYFQMSSFYILCPELVSVQTRISLKNTKLKISL